MAEKIDTPLQAAKVIKKSKSTMYRYIHDGTIQAVKVSEASYIVYQSAIDAYLEQLEKEQNAETEKSQPKG